MKNIKELVVITPEFGLEVGDILTRNNSDENFTCNSEKVNEHGTIVRSISVSPSLINKESFKVTDWFERRKTNREYILELESTVEKLDKQAVEDKNKIISLYNQLDKYESRMTKKLNEFKYKYEKLENDVKNDKFTGESIEWAEEGLTVYHNLIDLISKIKA